MLTLVDPTDPATPPLLTQARDAATQLGLELDIREVSEAADIERAFHSLAPGQVDGAFLLSPSMKLSILRAMECIGQRVHVNTHYARFEDAVAAMKFADESGWMPSIEEEPYRWEDIHQLANDYANGKPHTYFPLYQVNPL